jgi:hypothetical protein
MRCWFIVCPPSSMMMSKSPPDSSMNLRRNVRSDWSPAKMVALSVLCFHFSAQAASYSM